MKTIKTTKSTSNIIAKAKSVAAAMQEDGYRYLAVMAFTKDGTRESAVAWLMDAQGWDHSESMAYTAWALRTKLSN